MKDNKNIKNRTSRSWDLGDVSISHNIIDYHSSGTMLTANESELVRLHFGLSGSYHFRYGQLNKSFSLSGHHNNIMYSDGLELEVVNHSSVIETFGINFTPEAFIQIGENGNKALRQFTRSVARKEDAIFSNQWRNNNFRIREVISEIINSTFQDELENIFLLSKSIELLVLQAGLYAKKPRSKVIKSTEERKKLIVAKEIIENRIDSPPTISELARSIGLNEYKLKKGFKELFGSTVFGHIHSCRMSLAKNLLLGTNKTAKEIAYQTGYSSPQHFSNAFKKAFGVTPKSIRINPDSAIN